MDPYPIDGRHQATLDTLLEPLIILRPTTGDDGTLLCTWRDVTDRDRARTALRASETRCVGGEVEVESEVGVGTTFRLRSPLAAPAGATEDALR